MKLSVVLILLAHNITQYPTPETFPLPYGTELHCDKNRCWIERTEEQNEMVD